VSAAAPALAPAVLPCLACGAPLPVEAVSALALAPCAACGVAQRWELFPAFSAPVETSRVAEAIAAPGEEAACAFHPKKRAVAACGRCGLFVCALCELPVGEERICPTCLEKGHAQGKLAALETHRFLYDRLALMLVTYPLLLFYVTALTAPIALFVAIRFWKAPTSLVRPGKTRMVVAIVVAVLELAGWAVLAAVLVTAFARRNP
jgi:hypothetical protein